MKAMTATITLLLLASAQPPAIPEEDAYAEITSWGEYADVGCTEESRYKDADFDAICSKFEQQQIHNNSSNSN